MRRVKVGVIGTGMISGVYLKNLTGMFDAVVEVTAVADMMPQSAQLKAEQFDIPNVYTVDQLLADPETGPVSDDDVKAHEAHSAWQAEMERVFGLAELIIAKQRHGATGKVRLRFEPKITKFSDLAQGEYGYD